MRPAGGTDPASPHAIVTLAYPGAHLLNIAGPAEVFAAANRAVEERGGPPSPPYTLGIASRAGGIVSTAAGIEIATRPLGDFTSCGTFIIPGGAGIRPVMQDRPMLDWIRRIANAAERVVALGGGSFILASAGMMSGRRCAGHWRFEQDFRREYPDVELVRDALFVRDGRIITAAGSSASLDVAFQLVEADQGPVIALQVAAMLVIPRIRPGDQPQLSTEMRARVGAPPRIARALDWISENVANIGTVGELARRSAMSERNFSRAFREQTGMSPRAFIRQVRIEAAQRWLRGSSLSIEDVARRCGYSNTARLTQAMLAEKGMTPAVYREAGRPKLSSS